MMRFALILSVLFYGLIISLPAVAASSEPVYGRDRIFEGRQRAVENKTNTFYENLVKKMYQSGIPNDEDFATLRSYYPNTPHYVPFSDDVLNTMKDLSFQLQNNQDPVSIRNISTKYKSLVMQHFANIEVVFLAASLSRQDIRLGDPAFFEKAKEVLYETISRSNDGLSPRTAVKVLTFGEEDILLRRYGGGKLVKSELYENKNDLSYSQSSGFVSSSFLNIHHMKNSKTENITKLYFDISTPINRAEEERTEIEKRNKARKRF